MKIKDLIRRLSYYPQDATIGIIDVDNFRVEKAIAIYDDKDEVVEFINEMTIKDIEKFRNSNQDNICDFYIH